MFAKILKGTGESKNGRMGVNLPFHPLPLSLFQCICFCNLFTFSITYLFEIYFQTKPLHCNNYLILERVNKHEAGY